MSENFLIRVIITLSFSVFLTPISYYAVPPDSYFFDDGFFVMPVPNTQNDRKMVKLFSSPVLNSKLILESAREQEKIVKNVLYQRRKKLHTLYCSSPIKNRRQFIEITGNQIKNENIYQSKLALHFDSMVRSWLESRLENSPFITHRRKVSKTGIPDKRDFLVETELSRSMEARKTVERILQERRTDIKEFWLNLLEELEKNADSTEEECLQDIDLTEYFPKKKLLEPAALARYQFLSTLPDGVRFEYFLLVSPKK